MSELTPEDLLDASLAAQDAAQEAEDEALEQAEAIASWTRAQAIFDRLKAAAPTGSSESR